MMVLFKIFATGTFLFIYTTIAFSQSHKSLRKGDFSYDKKEFSRAEKFYRDATNKDSKQPSSVYNAGNALYRQGNYDDAAQHFQTAAKHPNATPGMQADALYNLGNSLLRQNKYQESVQAFENSLRIRPGDPQAKVNLQFAKKKQKEQEQKEQQKQNQQQDQKNKDQNQQQGPKNKDQQEQEQQKTNSSTAQQQEQQKQQQEQQEQQKISQAEARRLLETAIGPEDRKTAKKYKQQQASPQKAGEKDW